MWSTKGLIAVLDMVVSGGSGCVGGDSGCGEFGGDGGKGFEIGVDVVAMRRLVPAGGSCGGDGHGGGEGWAWTTTTWVFLKLAWS